MTLAGLGLLAALGAPADGDARPCWPWAVERAAPIAACALPAEGGMRVPPAALRELAFDDEHHLAVVSVDGTLLYVDRGGRTAVTLSVDNGPDAFVEGRARTRREGKVGFVDDHLREVIPARWDFAWPFEAGVAVVCEGCRPVAEGEHTRVEGGRWGYIDRQGRVVVAVTHAREGLPPHDEAVRLARAR